MLNGMKIAILVADGFEHVELTEPRKALEEQGAETGIVSPVKGQVQAGKHFDHSDKFRVDVPLAASWSQPSVTAPARSGH
jgi:protease I